MRHKLGFLVKILWVILILGITGACNSFHGSPTQGVTVTRPPVQETSTQTAQTSLPPTLVEPGETPQIILTVSLTPTVSPSQTPDLQAWNDQAKYYGTIIIADRDENNQFVLFRPDGIFQKIYQLDGRSYDPWRADQITDGCSLIALVKTDGGNKLVQFDQNGEIQHIVFSFQDQLRDPKGHGPALSPAGKFVAYVVFSGELYYDTAQYQDVEIVALDQPDLPIRLTTRGGAWEEGGVWSPEDAQIAYTDYDERGVLQVYLTKISDLAQQTLTQFQSPGSAPGPISWSPKGDRLAVILEDRQHNREVWIVPVPRGQAHKLNLPEGVVTIGDRMFWSEDGTQLLLHVGDYTPSNLAGLYWFDVENNRILHVLTEAAAAQINPRASSFAYPFPFTTDLSTVVFNSRNEWFSYNVINRQIEYLSWLNTRDWGIHMDVSVFSKNIFSCES